MLLQKGRLITEGPLDEIIAQGTAGGLSVSVAPEELDAAVRVISRLRLVHER